MAGRWSLRHDFHELEENAQHEVKGAKDDFITADLPAIR